MKKSLLFLLVVLTYSATAQDLGFSESKTEIGGYGELHYNYKNSADIDASEILDFHRFVIFYSHTFNEKWSFKSEFEVEHNFVRNNKGVVALEQAFIDYRHNGFIGFQAGIILISAGLINDIHEPPTFFGVERPDYNKYIIPTTWSGNGVALYGNISGFDYKISAVEGLNGDDFSPASAIRSGRQKGYLANAESLLYTARLNYTAIDGFMAGASASFTEAFRKDTIGINTTLVEFHLKYAKNNLFVSAEIGNIFYSDSDLESSFGFYADLGYNISNILKFDGKFIPFVRLSNINTASSFISGGDIEKQYDNRKIMIGINYLPIDEIVFKIDYAKVKNQLTDKYTTFFNLGVGYMF